MRGVLKQLDKIMSRKVLGFPWHLHMACMPCKAESLLSRVKNATSNVPNGFPIRNTFLAMTDSAYVGAGFKPARIYVHPPTLNRRPYSTLLL